MSDEPEGLVTLCWLIVILELDLLLWLGIVRGVESVLS